MDFFGRRQKIHITDPTTHTKTHTQTSSINRLQEYFPDLTPDIALMYLKNNNGDFDKTYDELLKERAPPKQRSSPKRVSPPKRASPPKSHPTLVHHKEDDGAGVLSRSRPVSSIPVSIPVPPPSKPVPLAIPVSPPKQGQSTKVSTTSTPLEQLIKSFPDLEKDVIKVFLEINNGDLKATTNELRRLQQQEKEREHGKTMRVSPPKQRQSTTSSTPLEQLIKSFPDLEVPAIEAVLEIKHGNLKEATNELRMIEQYEKKHGKKTSHRGETSRRASSSTQLIIPDFIDGNKPISRQLTFEDWIKENYHETMISEASLERKQKLEDLFDKKNWIVLDTKGDGWCGLYGTAVYYNLTNKDNPDFSPVSSKDDIIDKIMLAIDNYYIAREQHMRLKIPLPRQISSEDIIVEFTPAVEKEKYVVNPISGKSEKKYEIVTDPITGKLLDSDVITITLTHSDHSQKTYSMNQERELIKTLLSKFRGLPNIPNEIFALMPFAYKHNYLILRYDSRLKKDDGRYYTTYIPCLLDVRKVGDKIIYPYAEDNLIMYNNGHYFLLLNEKPIVLETVSKILGSAYEGWGLKNVGSGINVRKLRKSKYTTHKNKSKKANFTKNKKQKMRKHKYSVKKMRQPKNKSKKY